jgi:hypothetical protein
MSKRCAGFGNFVSDGRYKSVPAKWILELRPQKQEPVHNQVLPGIPGGILLFLFVQEK